MATLTRIVPVLTNTPNTSVGSNNTVSPLYQNVSSGQYNFNAQPQNNSYLQGSAVYGAVYGGGSAKDDYDLFTGAFGILANHYSNAIKTSLSRNINDLYGNIAPSITANSKNLTVNAFIDRELSSRQATVGTDFYYRKLGQDLVGNEGAAQYGAQVAKDFLSTRYTSKVANATPLTGVSVTPVPNGLKPNISNYGAVTFKSTERLSPIGFKGAFSSPRYSLPSTLKKRY